MCVHYWQCEATVGNETPARCRDCGVERVFVQPRMEWNDGAPPELARMLNRIRTAERLSLPPGHFREEGWG